MNGFMVTTDDVFYPMCDGEHPCSCWFDEGKCCVCDAPKPNQEICKKCKQVRPCDCQFNPGGTFSAMKESK